MPPYGIWNLGNTCYLNSSIQSLLPLLCTLHVHRAIASPTSWDQVILNELVAINGSRLKGEIHPQRLLYALQHSAPTFNFFDQNDVGEFLFILLDKLHLATRQSTPIQFKGEKKDSLCPIQKAYIHECRKLLQKMGAWSPVYDTFYGMQFTQIINANDKKVIRRQPDQFSIITLYPNPAKHWTLVDCIKSHCSAELLRGENAWLNEATGQKQAVYKRTMFWKLPRVLIFYINRAQTNLHKNRQLIQFPLELDMRPFMISSAIGDGCHKYVLQSVCNHHGHTIGSGHYTAFVRDVAAATWWHCNDRVVSPIGVNQIVTPNACCLFYVSK